MRVAAVTLFFVALLLGFYALACFLPSLTEASLQRDLERLAGDPENITRFQDLQHELNAMRHDRMIEGGGMLLATGAAAFAAVMLMRRTFRKPPVPDFDSVIVLPRIHLTPAVKPFGIGIVQRRVRVGSARASVKGKLERMFEESGELHAH